jgi:hypothetical protein
LNKASLMMIQRRALPTEATIHPGLCPGEGIDAALASPRVRAAFACLNVMAGFTPAGLRAKD